MNFSDFNSLEDLKFRLSLSLAILATLRDFGGSLPPSQLGAAVLAAGLTPPEAGDLLADLQEGGFIDTVDASGLPVNVLTATSVVLTPAGEQALAEAQSLTTDLDPPSRPWEAGNANPDLN